MEQQRKVKSRISAVSDHIIHTVKFLLRQLHIHNRILLQMLTLLSTTVVHLL